jgi:diaminopimelate decarboxylase
VAAWHFYIYDRGTLDAAAGRYKGALKAHYPAAASVTSAGKAFFCRAMAQWVGQQGIQVDCTGASEVAIAVGARLEASSIIVHGVNKSEADLDAATRHAGTIVVDNLAELKRLCSALAALRGTATPSIWLRLQPGAAVETHHSHTQTGQTDSKFGMTPEEVARPPACQDRRADAQRSPSPGSNCERPTVGAIVSRSSWPMRRVAGGVAQPRRGWGVAYHEDELPIRRSGKCAHHRT